MIQPAPEADRPSPAEPATRRKFFRDALAAVAVAPAIIRSRDKHPRKTELARRAAPQQIADSTIPPPATWADPRLRLVRRATMGLTAADVAAVKQDGYQQWLNDQVHYADIDDTDMDAAIAARYPLLSQTATQLSTANAGTVQNQLQEATIYRAAFSKRQLYERMVEFWSDHFNISITKVGYLKVVDDREVIRKYALGKFSDLLWASAHSGAMLAYLDQTQSRVGAPNQNYAREIMELHTLGVNGGYTQTDVAELSRVLTGWTTTGAGDFFFNAARHDFGAKTVLGTTIPASSPAVGAAAVSEGEQMLKLLASHPSTATFIATKLLKWLLTPEPTTSQINTIAGVFRATKGDIKLVVRAILNDAWVGNAPAKFKRPFHHVVSSLRATQPAVASTSGMRGQLNIVGQQLFFWETPDGYPDTVEYWSGNIEPRWSFATTMSTQNSATSVQLSTAAYLSGSPAAAIDKIDTDYFGGEMSLALRSALLGYISGGTLTDTRVRETIELALSAAEFQWY